MQTFGDLDLDFLIATAREAGQEILNVYETEFGVEHKADSSPLTEADLRSHRKIQSRLLERYPEIPILSEESAESDDYETRKDWPLYWLIDPLDGTKEFIKRNGQFTVNIALMENNRPVAGIVYAPALDRLYYGSSEGAFRVEDGGDPIRLPFETHDDPNRLVVVGSLSHPTPEMDVYIADLRARYEQVEFVAMGSSLKLCLVAEGTADIYPRLGPTMEWDTAAAHAVAAAAGRRVTVFDGGVDTGEDLPYNKPNLLNSWFVVR